LQTLTRYTDSFLKCHDYKTLLHVIDVNVYFWTADRKYNAKMHVVLNLH